MINLSRTCATTALAGLLVGCVDPEGRLDDFSERVIDAGESARIDAAERDEIPNATGTFLMGLSAAPAPDNLFQFLAEVTVDTSGDAVLDISAQPLDAETREPVGDPTGAEGVAISSSAEFAAIFAEFPEGSEDCDPPPDEPVVIPGAANPITGSELILTATLEGLIVTEDSLCGDVRGYEYGSLGCLNLAGSKFAAVRVEPGTTGDDLPDPVGTCDDLPGDNGNGNGADAGVEADAGE